MVNDNFHIIKTDGFDKFNIWGHSQVVKDLYCKRAQKIAEEMTCAAQACDILTSLVSSGDTILDAGCGSGYFYHSLQKRGIDAEYFGIDSTLELIEIGRREMPKFGLCPNRLIHCRIEDISAKVDHVICLNVLSNIDNFHKPLERLLLSARTSVIIRESMSDFSSSKYVQDNFLDDGIALNVYINTYKLQEVLDFIHSYGFDTKVIVDRRTNGKVESIIGHPHYWKFIKAYRRKKLLNDD